MTRTASRAVDADGAPDCPADRAPDCLADRAPDSPADGSTCFATAIDRRTGTGEVL